MAITFEEYTMTAEVDGSVIATAAWVSGRQVACGWRALDSESYAERLAG
jgi:hypothetical protein